MIAASAGGTSARRAAIGVAVRCAVKIVDALNAFAMPKSATIADELRSSTFSGFTSRWTTPRACASLHASTMSHMPQIDGEVHDRHSAGTEFVFDAKASIEFRREPRESGHAGETITIVVVAAITPIDRERRCRPSTPRLPSDVAPKKTN